MRYEEKRLFDEFGFDFEEECSRYNSEKDAKIKRYNKGDNSNENIWENYVKEAYKGSIGDRRFIRLLKAEKRKKRNYKEISSVVLIPVEITFLSIMVSDIAFGGVWKYIVSIILVLFVLWLFAHWFFKWQREVDFIEDFEEIIRSDEDNIC